MVEDKKISESAELLLKGAKMLKYHCPVCLLPLFKDNEKIFCPSCKTEYIIGENNIVPKAQVSGTEKREEFTKRTKRKEETITESVLDENLIKLIKKLIEKLVKRAISSESLNEIREITEIVERLIYILEKMR